MSTKAFKELNSLSNDELGNMLRDTRQALFKARIEKMTGQLKSPASLWQMRKKLARLQTRMTELANGKK